MRVATAFALSLFAGVASAQEFDAISIKPSPPRTPGAPMFVRSSGGPGTKDPTLYTCENCSLSSLIASAYALPHYRVKTAEWMASTTFIVNARVPPGASKEEFQLMLQHALAGCFKLEVHRDKKEMTSYELVASRGGPKLKPAETESPPVTPASGPPAPGPARLDSDGFPVLSGGSTMSMRDGRARVSYPKRTTEWFANMLASQLGTPVTDSTGLSGEYRFDLYWVTNTRDPDAGPTLFEALQSQLGLKLESRKEQVEILVVDHAEKLPSEN